MLFGSLIIDGITIILSGGQPDRFTFLFVPLVEMIIKFVMAGFAMKYEYARTNPQVGGEANAVL
jgi:hypothetical protein